MKRINLSHSWKLFLFISLVLGAWLRLQWGADVEYKADEQYMFERVLNVNAGAEAFPWVGMHSGVRTVNPGMSVWVFLGLSKIYPVKSPIDLARAVQLLNILALLLLALFALWVVSAQDRLVWLWATALACVNPLAVLYHRKIWAQSTLSFFCVLFLLGWWKRDRWWGAFLWGLLGVCLGQIHMSGFFLALILLVWTLAFGSQGSSRNQGSWTPTTPMRWRYWILGSCLGALFLIPWMMQVGGELVTAAGSAGSRLRLVYWLSLLRFWITDALGLGLKTSLGEFHFSSFLSYPILFNFKIGLMGLLHIVISVIAIAIFLKFIWNFFGLFKKRRSFFAMITGQESHTALLQNAFLIGLPFLIFLTGFPTYRHYLLITFPLEWVWISRQIIQNPLKFFEPSHLLGMIWVCNLLLSVGFLYYIHVNHGAVGGDYGIAFSWQ